MADAQMQTGSFLFSLDTELAWGYFHLDQERLEFFSPDGSRERGAINRLLDIMEEFGILATWGVIGHLFYEKCEDCELCPVLAWQGKYRSFEEIYRTNNPLWYGADIIENLLSRGPQHEIAFHGYTHKTFDVLSEEEARIEIQEWLRLAGRKGIVPSSAIFPRNVIGHLSIIKEAGINCYRGRENISAIYQLKRLGKLVKYIDYTLGLSASRVYEVAGVDPNGLVDLPASEHFFGYHYKLERFLDRLGLHNLRIRRMVKGVKQAASENKLFHVWAHPWEFQTEKDFEKLRYLLGYVADEISKGRMRSIRMADLAQEVIEKAKINQANT